MDLFAYSQIDNLDKIAKANEIDIPRLRGYRLMKDEETVTKEQIKKIQKEMEITIVEWLVVSDPFWDPNSSCSIWDWFTDIRKKYYLIREKDEDGNIRFTGIRWDRIHGKKRKILKYEIKKANRDIEKQFEIWNKYAGQEDVLYIHSRMGGGNWQYFDNESKQKLINQPWFLDRVDDYFDSTYCDFYAKINMEVCNG